MTRLITLLAALVLAATASVSSAVAANDGSKHQSWEAKKLAKIVDHCEARLAKADDADEVAEARAGCVAAIGEFFAENSNVEVSPELAARFAGLLVSLGISPDLATKQGWDIKDNKGG
jgi:hypothetical protein